MSESVSAPPYHEEVARTSVTKNSDSIWFVEMSQKLNLFSYFKIGKHGIDN